MSRTLRRHLKLGAAVHDVDVAAHGGRYAGHIDGRRVEFDASLLRRIDGGAEVVLEVDGGRTRAVVLRHGDAVFVHHAGRTWRFTAVTPRPGGDAADDGGTDPFVASPMTGVVRKVLAAPGDRVAAGAALCVVEAMKMEFSVTAPRDVVVAEVRAAVGDRVDIQQVLVTFEAEPAK